jgi:hypothetical protein
MEAMELPLLSLEYLQLMLAAVGEVRLLQAEHLEQVEPVEVEMLQFRLHKPELREL